MLAVGYVSATCCVWEDAAVTEEQGMSDTRETYELPVIEDYGDLVELTAASGFSGPEDGGSKLAIHHTAPASP